MASNQTGLPVRTKTLDREPSGRTLVDRKVLNIVNGLPEATKRRLWESSVWLAPLVSVTYFNFGG